MTDSRIIDSKECVKQIVSDIKRGYRFTPLIGSGFSSPSGIIMGEEFNEYLAFVFFRCVAKKSEQEACPDIENEQIIPWNIRKNGWPAKPKPTQTKYVKDWVKTKFIQIYEQKFGQKCFKNDNLSRFDSKLASNLETQENFFSVERFKIPPCPEILSQSLDQNKKKSWITRNDESTIKLLNTISKIKGSKDHDVMNDFFDNIEGVSTHTYQYAIEAGIRALYDWKTTIRFLSRLKNEDKSFIFLKEPDQAIIDSFNKNIVENKHPNQAHNVLTNLMRPLRIRLWLTTNFDSLIERSIKNLNVPISVLELSNKSKLPSATLVHTDNTLIKLHGGTIDTRADFTLNDSPPPEELATFSEYFYSKDDLSKNYVPSQLLIMGFSGRDKRIIDFLKYSLDHNKKFKIYWVVYSNNDISRITSLFPENHFNNKNIRILKNERVDLLLFELYQQLTLSLPSSPIPFEIAQHIPPNEENPKEITRFNKEFEIIEKAEKSKIKNIIRESTQKKRTVENTEFIGNFCKVVKKTNNGALIVLDGKSGVMNCARNIFHELKESNIKCVWLELNDFIKPISVITKIIRLIANEIGFSNRENVIVNFPNTNIQIDEIKTHLGFLENMLSINPNDWCIFLFGRNGPGTSSGWDNKPWGKIEYSDFEKVKNTLLELGFKLVYMPFSNTKSEREKDKLSKINEHFETSESLRTNDDYLREMSLEIKSNSGRKHYTYIFEHDYAIDIKESIKESGKQELNLNRDGDFFEKKLRQASFIGQIYKGKHATIKEREEDAFIQRSLFCYDLTLFRQSRLITSFISEEMTNSTNFPKNGNEEKNFTLIQNWLNEATGLNPKLSKILFKKEGDFYWQYRDIRMMIQRTLESSVTFNSVSKSNWPFETIYIYNLRAQQHYQISEWYVKSVYLLKNINLLNEAIYHKLAAINFLDFLIPLDLDSIFSRKPTPDEAIETLVLYRFNFLHIIIIELAKLIKTSKALITKQGAANSPEDTYNPDIIFSVIGLGNKETPFSKFISEEVGALDFVGNWITDKIGWSQIKEFPEQETKEKFRETIKVNKHLRVIMLDSLINLFLEYRKLSKAKFFISRKDTFKGGLQNDNKQLEEIKKVRGHYIKPLNQSLYYEPRNYIENNNSFGIESFSDELKKFKSAIETALDFQGLFRSSFLNTNYFNSKDVIEELLGFLFSNPIKENKENLQNGHDESTINQVALSTQFLFANDDYKILLVSRIICKLLYFYIRRNKLVRRIQDSHTSCLFFEWNHVNSISKFAMKLLKILSPAYQPEEFEISNELLTYQAIALTKLNRFYAAHKVLNDATALIENSSSTIKKTQIAILRIRRTETHLEIANKILELKDKLEKENYSEYRESVQQCGWFESQIQSPKDTKDEKKIAEENENLERVYAVKIEDAQTSLNNAEYLLIDNDRSKHWWQLLYLLKLKLFRMGLNSNINIKSIVFSKKVDYVSKATSAYKRGMFISSFEPFTKLRMIDEYSKTLRAMEKDYKNPNQLQSVEPVSVNKLNNLTYIFLKSLNETGYSSHNTSNLAIQKNSFLKFILDKSSSKFNPEVEQYFESVFNEIAKWTDAK